MATFKEFMRVAEITFTDKTSGKRMREILGILHKYHIMKGLTPERAVQLLEALGPTFVKIGQLASTRSDMLPKEYCDAFEQLHDDVSPLPFEEILACINEAYQRDWSDVFLAIDPNPLGSASIAQVHRAVLLDGTVVAVKVRRPGIVEEMSEDITLMKRALATADFISNAPRNILMSLQNFLTVLEETTANELDFTKELMHLQIFQHESRHWRGVTSPVPYPAFSTDAVLVMEYVQGIEIDNVEKLKAAGYNMQQLADRLVQNYVSQVIDDGFFQADPHPGNILVREGELVWIDLGMTGTLTSSERQLVGRMFRAVATKDSYMLMDAVLGISKQSGDVNNGLLLSQLSAMLDKYGTATLADIDIAAAFGEIIEVMRDQNLIMLPEVTMLVRGFATLEGVLDAIAPNTNVIDIVSEHVIKQSLEPEHLKMRMGDIATNIMQSGEAMTKLPQQLSNTLDMLDRGELRVKGDVNVGDNALATIYASVGRLSLAGISMGLFIGSSILCTTGMKPTLLEVPVLGVLGYLGAFILGVYVIAVTLKSRHKMMNNQKVD